MRHEKDIMAKIKLILSIRKFARLYSFIYNEDNFLTIIQVNFIT